MIDISKLSKEELIKLNKEIIERLNAISARELLGQISTFNVSDIVSFDNNGKKSFGVILRGNQKTISVAISTHERWKMSPTFLTLVKKPSKTALDLQFELFPFKFPERVLKEFEVATSLKIKQKE